MNNDKVWSPLMTKHGAMGHKIDYTPPKTENEATPIDRHRIGQGRARQVPEALSLVD